MRRPIIAGNWKMYKDAAQTRAFFEEFKPLLAESRRCEIVICPPFVSLAAAVDLTRGTGIQIGAQNLFWAKEGAYTGEISAEMLTAVGCRWVLIGHSERREYFGENEASVYKRTVAALDAGLTPIVCVGEVAQERESGQTQAVLEVQFGGGISPLQPEQFAKIVIAYEPVWAIGTGKTATPRIAADAHQVIRGLADRRYGGEAASKSRILYGGSVKPENARKLMAEEEIDGALVGGASLDPASFAAIVNYGASNSK